MVKESQDNKLPEGLYVPNDTEHVIVADLTVLLAQVGLANTQEYRAILYAQLSKVYAAMDTEVVLLEDYDITNLVEGSNNHD